MIRSKLAAGPVPRSTAVPRYATHMAQPGDVAEVTISGATPHKLTINWSQYTGEDFVRYDVRTSSAAGVTATSPLLASFESSEMTSVTDSGLIAYTTHYYRVFVVDTADAVSTGVEASARTSALYYPHTDTVDSANVNFVAAGRWAVVPNSPGEGDAYSGSYHWSDSPGGNYDPSTNSALTLTINLGTATMPALTYWDRYSFQSQVGLRLYRSLAGRSSWSQAGFVTGSQTTWARKQIDLTQWAGYGEVRVRFRSVSDAATESDGWHLDDFSVTEPETPSLPYPFVEDFEDSEGPGRQLAHLPMGNDLGGHDGLSSITDSD